MAKRTALEVELWRHQQQLIAAPWDRPDINYFFLIGGYGCGKTSGDVFFLFNLVKRYARTPITVGVFGITITLLRKTLIGEFIKYLVMTGTKYTDDKNANTLTVGSVTIHLIALEQPSLIYAYNLNISLVDELDELPADKCMTAFMAIQERTRVTLPDGRPAFSVFTTTAQGYSGTYSVVESLRDANQKFVIIRGRTVDNKALSQEYIDRLYALYDDNERLAYLEGYFVNLNTGKVYGDYDPSVNLGHSNMRINSVHIIQIGQDFNAGFSKGVALVKDGVNLRAVRTFNFKQIQAAPMMIRNSFPENKVYWYPDASSKDIMAGYVKEIRENDIEVKLGSVNPPIVERIMFVNKLFKTHRLTIDPICRDLDIALKTRQFDDSGKPEKGRGENATDHVCVTGDTLVSTSKGQVPISTIAIGDEVLTRQGYKRVVSAMCTGFADVAAVYGVKATKDHPFYNGEGFVQAGKLSIWDVPYAMTQKETDECQILKAFQSSLMELSTDDILNPITPKLETIMLVAKTVMVKTIDSIGPFGLRPMARYLKAFMSIIKMEIGLITNWLILNASKREGMYQDTCKSYSKLIQASIKQVLRKPEKRQRHGMLVMKAVHGIANMLLKVASFQKSKSYVSVVAKSLSVKQGLNTALRHACLELVGTLASTMYNGIVSCVEKYSLRVSTVKPYVVQPAMQLSLETSAVYNITVEDEHEYFANGILVSNCDALEYSAWRIVLSDPDFRDLWVLSRANARSAA
jgi:hypothetical protein